MPTTTTKTIGSTGDYTTLQAWEDACPANLVTADEIWRGELQNQEFVVSGNILTISGQTTDSTRYVELTTASGASFADNANKLTNALRYNASNGAAMRSNGSGAVALSITTAYTRLSKFQFKDGNTSPTNAILINTGNCTLNQIIAESVNNGDSTIRVSSGTGHVFSNVLAVNYGTSANDHGFVNVGGTVAYYNCTAIKPSNVGAVASGFVAVYATSTVKNCGAFGFTKFSDLYIATFTGNNNASDATIAFGTSNQASLTFADQIEQPNSATGLDCRAKSGATIIDNGADLSGSGVTTDIVGTARGATYDIGVWEYVAAGGSYSMTVDAGSFAMTGQAVALKAARRIAAGQSAFTLTGQDVALRAARRMTVAASSFSLSGQDVALKASRRLAVDQASFTLTGQDAALRADRRLQVAAGSFALSGQDVSLRFGRFMIVEAGIFALTGQDVAFRAARALTLGTGSFTLTGQTVDFSYGPVTITPGGYVVLEVLTGTFADGEALSDSSGGAARALGTVVFGDYLFDLRGGSVMTMASGELLQSGFSHRGGVHAARLESSMDQIIFGDVWGYNWQTASGDWATGYGRISFNNHIGPGNALLPRMMLRNSHMDAFGGNGGVRGTGTWEDMGFSGGPADSIGLDFSAHSDEGTAASSRGLVPWEQEVSGDATVFRTAGHGSLKLLLNPFYSPGELELRVFVPVTGGKIVLSEFYHSKPDVKPSRIWGIYTSGLPTAPETIFVNTTDGSSIVTIEDKHVQWIGGSGPRAGWGVTLTDVTGDPGGILNAVWNATHTVISRTGAYTFTVDLGSGNEATSTVSDAGGAAIESEYEQTSVLIYSRLFWVRRQGFDAAGRPILVQAQFQGEKEIYATLAAQDWTRWDLGTWYAEPTIPSAPTDRTARGRAPDWATDLAIIINWSGINECDPGAAPPWYLTDFYANVI